MRAIVQEISELNAVPIKQWIDSDASFKFVGDNIDFMEGVRDIRSNHQKHLCHMYSILTVKSRVPVEKNATSIMSPITFNRLLANASSLLPKESDISSIRLNLAILVSRVLCQHIKGLKPCQKFVPQHILHRHTKFMAKKSEVAVLDVLFKNEARHQDMLDIMKHQQCYIGDNFVGKVLSGGDLLTCERQRCAQNHVMDGDTPKERLELLLPVIEDWHTLMCLLEVS